MTGVEAEVYYMFHGPLGIQTRDYTIKPEIRQALATAVDTLKLLKKTDTTLDVDTWIDDRFIRQAARAEGLDYDARLKDYAAAAAARERRAHRRADPRAEAGRARSGSRARPRCAPTRRRSRRWRALAELARQGKPVRAAFVHDRETGVKLFADQAFFVANEARHGADPAEVVAAFLTEERAQAWAHAHHGRVRPPARVTAAAQP